MVTRNFRCPSVPGMAYRLAFALALIVSSDIPLLAQFGSPYPGQGGVGFPGGGISLPGTNRRNNGNVNGPVSSLVGKIQRISTTQLVLTMDDDRNITVALDRNTRYFDNTGNNARFGDFDIGDQVSVDAATDNQNFYHGRRVSMIQRASANNDTSSSKSSSSDSSDDSDKPRLKRADSSSTGSANSTSSVSPSNDDPDRPRLTRSGSSSAGSNSDSGSSVTPPLAQSSDSSSTTVARRPSTSIAPKPVANEADDPGPPVLRRNAPARVDNTPPAGSEQATQIASSRPSIKAEDSNGVTRPPAPPVVSSGGSSDGYSSSVSSRSAPPQRPGDPVINGARDAAFEFTDTLPNYIVKQYTTRYQTDTAHGSRTSWQALDVVTADVVAENGKESYKNILVNGKPPRDAIEKTGSWSTGEFATVLQGILAPQTDADFHNKRSTTIVNRPAYRYDYSVEQPNSMWHVYASSESYIPGYTGSIWIDKENFRVLRIEMSAVNMPKSFALDAVESAVDYDYVMIGDKKHLLPVHSEALSCVRNTSDCTRNVIEFRNYKKFTADSSITFDDK
jgi:hypothetical protein